jgi:hypothetical protein
MQVIIIIQYILEIALGFFFFSLRLHSYVPEVVSVSCK